MHSCGNPTEALLDDVFAANPEPRRCPDCEIEVESMRATLDVLTRSCAAAQPNDAYWRRYSARLSARLREPRPRRSVTWWLAPAAVAAAIAVAFVLMPVQTRSVHEPTTAIADHGAAPHVVVAPTGSSAAAQPEPRREESPRRDVTPASASKDVESAAAAQPQAAPELIEIAQVHQAVAEPVVSVESPAPAAAGPEPTAPAPTAFRIADSRLLRNGDVIASGATVEAPAGGVVWFTDERGERFIVSLQPGDGLVDAGVVRDDVLTFDWKDARFHWLSSGAITEGNGERRVYVGCERMPPIGPVVKPPLVRERPPRRPGWRFPAGRGGRFDVSRGLREEPRANDSLPDVFGRNEPTKLPIRFGSAASLAELRKR